MKAILRNVWLAVLPTLVVSSVSAAGLVNGSFETPTFSASIISYTPPSGSVPAPAVFGWTVTTGDINALTSAYWQPSEGSQSIELNGEAAASIYQDFTFSGSGEWRVRFDMSANPDLGARGDGQGSGLKSLRVEFGVPGALTNLGIFRIDAGPRQVNNMQWVTFETFAVILSSSVVYRLQFTSLDPGNAGPALDNVILTPFLNPGLRISEVEFCWDSERDHIYQVQYRSELTANNWMDLLGTNVTGTGNRLCVPDRVSGDSPRRFYRVTQLE